LGIGPNPQSPIKINKYILIFTQINISYKKIFILIKLDININIQ